MSIKLEFQSIYPPGGANDADTAEDQRCLSFRVSRLTAGLLAGRWRWLTGITGLRKTLLRRAHQAVAQNCHELAEHLWLDMAQPEFLT